MSLESVAPFEFVRGKWIPALMRNTTVTVRCNICGARGVSSVHLIVSKAAEWALRDSNKAGWKCIDETHYCPNCKSVFETGGRRGPTAGATTPKA